MLWNKLAANCVINPLTSIFRCTNGELLLEPSFLEMQENILMEVANVASGVLILMEKEKEAAEKGRINITTTTTESIIDDNNNKSSIRLVDEMRKFVSQCILDTRDNKSSMYQDIMKGQYTEIKHLNGYVVRKGKEMGIYCPYNEYLYQRILELQNQSI
jgi:2-dehydropantoate 2-reductase